MMKNNPKQTNINCKLHTDIKTSNVYPKKQKMRVFSSSSHPGEVEGVSVNVLEYNLVVQLRAHVIQLAL